MFGQQSPVLRRTPISSSQGTIGARRTGLIAALPGETLHPLGSEAAIHECVRLAPAHGHYGRKEGGVTGFCRFRDVSGNGSVPTLPEPRTHVGCSDRSPIRGDYRPLVTVLAPPSWARRRRRTHVPVRRRPAERRSLRACPGSCSPPPEAGPDTGKRQCSGGRRTVPSASSK